MNVLLEYILDRLPLIYVFLSGIGFSFQALAVKLLAEKHFHGSFPLAWTRGVFQLFLSSSVIYFSEERRRGNAPKLFGDTPFVTQMLIARSIVGFIAISLGFLSTEYISVGDSTVLVMLSPTMASILGYLLLSEPWRMAEVAATIVSLVGAVFICRPPFLFGSTFQEDNNQSVFYYGVTLAVASAIGSSFVFILVRILGTTAKIPWAYVTFSQALGQIFLAPASMLLLGIPFSQHFDLEIILLIISAGFIGAISQIAMTVGMQREKSASATAMRMSDVVFGYLWQLLFTADGVDALSIIGAILVSFSIVIVIIFKPAAKESQPPQDANDSIELGKVSSSNSVASDHTYSIVSQSDLE